MSQAVDTYLDRVMVCAKIDDPMLAEQARAEQQDHLEEKIERLERDGTAREDAIFQAIEEHGDPATVGYGLRPSFPLIDVRVKGTARGVIAIGPKAVGVVALGGVSCGVFAFGGVAFGAVTCGGASLALLFAYGGMALSLLGVAVGGVAIGLLAMGGMGIGLVAHGGLAIGMYARGGQVTSHYTPDNVPDWMASLADLAPDPQTFTMVNMGLVAMTLVMVGVSQVPLTREQKRIDKVLQARSRAG